MKTLTRGQLARRCGVGAETIRFYERQGLLPPPQRSEAGYRHFTLDTVQRLDFIRRAKELGFNLKEIAELLALQDDEHSDRAQVKALAEHKVAEIKAKLRDLQRMHDVLAELATHCSGHGSLGGCPIIGALTDDASAVSAPISPEVKHERKTRHG